MTDEELEAALADLAAGGAQGAGERGGGGRAGEEDLEGDLEEVFEEDFEEDLDPFADLSEAELDELDDEGGLSCLPSSYEGVPEGFKSGFVALVGRPNAGKSTLLNACFGRKVAITSPVAQTTRRRLRAVVNRPGCQLVIVDTPGIHKPQDPLGTELNKTALAELSDVDVIAFLIDASVPIGRGDEWVARRVAAAAAPKVLVLTKADKVEQARMVEQLERARELVDFDDEIVVSAVEGFNVEPFVQTVAALLPLGPRWFPEGMGTDESDEAMAAEFVREKVLLRTREEVPHAVGVLCDSLERTKRLVRVHATIYVEREGQKGILIGHKGEMVKRIGTDARRDLEELFGRKVYLELGVKVKKNWRDDETQIRRFGYSSEE